MAKIQIFALGGQDENGKSSIVIKNNEDIFVVNAGLKTPINNLNGIDGIIPNFNYLIKHKKNIKGIFLTHAQDEVFAALPWLIMDVPGITIYGSKYTLQVAKERISKYKLGHNDFKLKAINGNVNIDGFNIKTFEMAAATPGALCYNFQTEDGDILVIGASIIENLGSFGNTNLERIKKESNNILALLLDSRTSNLKGSSSDMKSIIPSIKDFFESAKSNERIIIGAFDEEVFTINEIIQLAKKANRPVIPYGKTFAFLFSLLKSEGKVDVPDFVDFKKSGQINNAVILVTGTWSRLYQRFVRIAHNNDVFLKFKESDNIIMISPPINGMEVEYANSMDEVAKVAPNILDVSDKDYYKLRPAADDISRFIKELKPKYFYPINGLYRYLVVASKIAIQAGVTQDRNIILQNGKISKLFNGEILQQKSFIKEYGDVIIDGFGVGDVSYEVIKERQSLAAGGLITIALQLDRKTKKPLGEMNIQIIGLVIKKNLKEAQDLVRNVVLQKIDDAEEFDFREIQNQIRKRTRKVIQKNYDKEPLVIVTFYEV